MKPKSINQLNALIRNSAIINHYRAITDRNHPDYQNSLKFAWKSEYYKKGERNNEYNPHIPTNYICFAGWQEIYRAAGKYNAKGYPYQPREAFKGNLSGIFPIENIFHYREIKYYVHITMDKGIYMSIDVSHFDTYERTRFFNFPYERNYETRIEIPIKSNQSLDEFDAEKFAENYLRKFFCPPGIFRNIQFYKTIGKKEAIAFYRTEFKEFMSKKEPVDVQKAWRQLIKRDKNLLISDSLRVLDWPKFYKTLDKSEIRKTVVKSPSPFYLLEEYHYDHDDDESMESWYYNYMEDNYPANKYLLI